MRILFAIHAWHPEGRGGTEVHARSVALGLSLREHQVGVFARTGAPGRPPYEVTTSRDGPIGVTRINNLFSENGTLEWVYKNRPVHEAFERELDEFKPDLVHVHHLTGLSTTIVETLKLRGIPVVMTLHDFWTVCPRGQRLTKDLVLCEDVDRSACYSCLAGLWPHLFADQAAEPVIVDVRGRLAPRLLAEWDRHLAYTLRLCDLLVCPSEFHRERMLEFPLDPERVVALPHGIDGSFFAAAPRADRPPRVIGYLGAVIPPKGVHVLVEAFQRLGRPDLRLEIHGEVPPFHDDRGYGERLRAAAAGHPGITFHGPYEASDVPRILEGIDVLVVPSLWWESYCITLREGLLAGIPVVASDLGAMREALDGERKGLLFRAGDPESLKRALVRILEDEELRRSLAAGPSGVKPLDRYLDELLGVYARARELAQRRAGTLVVAPPFFPPPAATAAGAPATPEAAAAEPPAPGSPPRRRRETITNRARGRRVPVLRATAAARKVAVVRVPRRTVRWRPERPR